MSDLAPTAAPGDLQFQHAEPLPQHYADPNAKRCVVCKTPINITYFHAQGQVVCPGCASRIQSGQQKPPVISLGNAALYGVGAALAGAAIYAAVAILLNIQIGIVAILIGYMVGKAVRAGSKGLGGRPQQILAVLLTYFAITTSYIPVFIYELKQDPGMFQKAKRTAASPSPQQTAPTSEPQSATAPTPKPPVIRLIVALLFFLLVFAAAPLLGLANPISGLITLFIIYIGLQRAWRLTGRSEVLVMGPYEAMPAQ
jgi:hypothetical protein